MTQPPDPCGRPSLHRAALPCMLVCLWSCSAPRAPVTTPNPSTPRPSEDNPPAQGFNRSGSDARAVAIADATMRRMGGRSAWDRTRYLTWRFFGKRLHVWDKWTGDVRVEYDDKKSGEHHVILMNIHSRKGRAFTGAPGSDRSIGSLGEVTDPGQLDAMLKRGLEMWINDSYWLVMPYKLKDSGVTLRYKGEAAMEDGRPAEVLALTFERVGVTPENKYDVYVAKDTGLVEQWAFYEKAGDEKPQFATPWRGWARHGEIQLSADRGQGKAHTDVAVLQSLPEKALRSPEPITLP